MPVVTNVVFDIGNVLIRWDPAALYGRLIPDPQARARFRDEICSDDWNRQIDGGRPLAEAIADLVARHPTWEREIRAWDAHWHEMVPGAIEGTVAILEALRGQGVPTWAITNFSAEKFVEAVDRFPFLGGFRDTVVSAHERLLKPDPAIYRVLLARGGLDPAACLFVDDVAENVEGARAVGMRAVRFVSPARLRDDLRAHGVAVD